MGKGVVFYDDSDRRTMSSTRTLVTLLRPWIRRFTIIISAWWLRTSSKFTWEEVKTPTGKLGKWSTPKRVRIRPKHSAPSLSRDRRIKMHQSINQSIVINGFAGHFRMTRVTVQLLSSICHRGKAKNTKENFIASSSFSRRLHDEMGNGLYYCTP